MAAEKEHAQKSMKLVQQEIKHLFDALSLLQKKLPPVINTEKAAEKEATLFSVLEEILRSHSLLLNDDNHAIDLRWRFVEKILLPKIKTITTHLTSVQLYEDDDLTLKNNGSHKVAPLSLLSLRDYSTIQSAIEFVLSWGIFPRITPEIALTLKKKTLSKKSIQPFKQILQINYWFGANLIEVGEILVCLREILPLMKLSPFHSILLPSYVDEIFAALIFLSINSFKESDEILFELTQSLAVKVQIGSLRSILGRMPAKVSKKNTLKILKLLKLKCSTMLTVLVMGKGGVAATVQVLLSAVPEGDTQAILKVCSLISRCPSNVTSFTYLKAIGPQVVNLLTVVPSDESSTTSKATIFPTFANLVIQRLILSYPSNELDEIIFYPILKPLLMYDYLELNPEAKLNRKLNENELGENVVSEEEFDLCIQRLHVLLNGPTPERPLLLALIPVYRPLIHMYSFVSASKSRLKGIVFDLLKVFVKQAPFAAPILQCALLPETVQLRDSLIVLLRKGFAENAGKKLFVKVKFGAGSSGGVVLRYNVDLALDYDLVMEVIVQLLSSTELENCDLIGDFFSSLLTTFMELKTNSASPLLTLPPKAIVSKNETMSSTLEYQLPFYEYHKYPKTLDGIQIVLHMFLSLVENLGPAVLRSAQQILNCIAVVLDGAAAGTHENEEADGDVFDILTVCLGLVTLIVEAGVEKRKESEENILRGMLPSLIDLSMHKNPQIAEMASELRVGILARGGCEQKEAPPNQSEKKQTDKPFDQVLEDAEMALQSELVPMRAYGVRQLTKLVRHLNSSWNNTKVVELENTDPQEILKKHVIVLLSVFIKYLADEESYVYLAAVQGLASLGDYHSKIAIPLLVDALLNKQQQHSIEQQIKLSEALTLVARRCGDAMPKYGHYFVNAYIHCIRPSSSKKDQNLTFDPTLQKPLIEEIPSIMTKAKIEKEVEEIIQQPQLLPAFTLRASCLSNLAEVCSLLSWSIYPYITDILSCAVGIIQFERQNSIEENSVRRGAIFLLYSILQGIGSKILEIVPGEMKSIYGLLNYTATTDKDKVTRFHAKNALNELDSIMKGELFS